MFFDSATPWRNRVSSALVGALGRGARRSRLRPLRRENRRLLGIDHLIEKLEGRTLLSTPTITVGPNVNVSKEAGNQAEEVIYTNPTNPNNLIAVSNDLTSAGAVQQPSWYSMDGGTTWTQSLLPNPSGATLIGDPTLVFDHTGRAVFADLAGSSGGNVFLATEVSTNGGASWTASAIDPASVFDDKEWLAVGPDRLNPGHERFYLGYDDHAIGNVEKIFTSTDGLTWTGPVTVDPAGNGLDTHVSVAPDGTVDFLWGENGTPGVTHVDFASSVDDGATWSPTSTIYTGKVTPGDSIPAQPDRGILMSLNMDVDHSGGPHNGRIYVTFTDAPVSHDDTNIYLMSSDNGGATFSTPVKVNNDTTTNSQFQSALAVDQTTGFVGVTWLDARNAGATNNTVQEFGTISTDGGSTFLPNFQISAGTSNEINAPDNPFPWVSDFDYGEYTGLSFVDGQLHPVWADNSNSTGDNPDGATSLDIYTAKVTITTQPTITATADKTTLWPPNGKLVPVTVTGTITDPGIFTASFRVVDEYGTVHPSGPITVNSDGTFSFTVYLEASRKGQDQDGRLYQIFIDAVDASGPQAHQEIDVTVPHDQGN